MADNSQIDHAMMQRALELAARGVGLVSPGPLVGTVIIDPNQEIVGEGFYIFDEMKHAETLALEQAGDNARGATAYVSLEPHAHQGRTAPCTEALIKAGIKRVVVPIEDPNPEVSGRGFAHLRGAGVDVCTGVLREEAARLNESYIHFMRTGRPFVYLKMAVSLDGKVATANGESRWITGEESRARVHELRHQSDAIMVGGGTVRADNPMLTDRSGKRRRRPLLRVIVDQCLHISEQSHLARTAHEAPVIVFTRPGVDSERVRSLQSQGVEVIERDQSFDALFLELGCRSIQSVLVEGGATLAGLLIDAGLIDKVSFFIAPMIIGGQDALSAIGGAGANRIADAVELRDVQVRQRGRDVEITGYPANTSGQ